MRMTGTMPSPFLGTLWKSMRLLALVSCAQLETPCPAQVVDSAATRASAWSIPVDTANAVAPLTTAQQTAFKLSSLYGSLSASYAANQNWGGQNMKNFAFMGNMLYRHSLFSGSRSHMHQFMADLGYLKFVDSVWVKNMDRLQTNFLWSSSGKRFNQSYSVAFGTQFLPSTFQDYDFGLNVPVQRSVGGFLNPFTLDAGYGAVLTFWNTSNINFAFATVRLNSSPKELTPAPL